MISVPYDRPVIVPGCRHEVGSSIACHRGRGKGYYADAVREPKQKQNIGSEIYEKDTSPPDEGGRWIQESKRYKGGYRYRDTRQRSLGSEVKCLPFIPNQHMGNRKGMQKAIDPALESRTRR